MHTDAPSVKLLSEVSTSTIEIRPLIFGVGSYPFARSEPCDTGERPFDNSASTGAKGPIKIRIRARANQLAAGRRGACSYDRPAVV